MELQGKKKIHDFAFHARAKVYGEPFRRILRVNLGVVPTVGVYRLLVRGWRAALVGQCGWVPERQVDVMIGRRRRAAGGRRYLRARAGIHYAVGRVCCAGRAARDAAHRAQRHLLAHHRGGAAGRHRRLVPIHRDSDGATTKGGGSREHASTSSSSVHI